MIFRLCYISCVVSPPPDPTRVPPGVFDVYVGAAAQSAAAVLDGARV